ncbi:hypothetical protein PMAYCL1PPCAC_15023, partial [Pristionchus mayeri]
RMIPAGRMIANVYLGPCVALSNFFCRCLFIITLVCYTQSLYLLAASFGYRLYVLKRNTPQPWQVLLVCSILISTNLPAMLVLFITPDDSDALRHALEIVRPEYNLDGYEIEGKLNIFDPRVIITIISIILLNICIQVLIGVLRRKVLAIGEQSNSLSVQTMKMHRALTKVLSLQSLLPISFSFSIIAYILCQSDTLYSPIIEHFITEAGLVVPLISPVITLTFVQPYRAIRGGDDFMQMATQNIINYTDQRVNL